MTAPSTDAMFEERLKNVVSQVYARIEDIASAHQTDSLSVAKRLEEMHQSTNEHHDKHLS